MTPQTPEMIQRRRETCEKVAITDDIEWYGERFLFMPDGCWEWIGKKNHSGYGRGRKQVAHREIYELIRGPIQGRLVLDHLCCNTSCVNPDHLEPVNRRVNMLRGGVTTPRREYPCR